VKDSTRRSLTYREVQNWDTIPKERAEVDQISMKIGGSSRNVSFGKRNRERWITANTASLEHNSQIQVYCTVEDPREVTMSLRVPANAGTSKAP